MQALLHVPVPWAHAVQAVVEVPHALLVPLLNLQPAHDGRLQATLVTHLGVLRGAGGGTTKTYTKAKFSNLLALTKQKCLQATLVTRLEGGRGGGVTVRVTRSSNPFWHARDQTARGREVYMHSLVDIPALPCPPHHVVCDVAGIHLSNSINEVLQEGQAAHMHARSAQHSTARRSQLPRTCGMLAAAGPRPFTVPVVSIGAHMPTLRDPPSLCLTLAPHPAPAPAVSSLALPQQFAGI